MRMVNTMNPEKRENPLTRWLLIATIALLALVLGLQLWQMFGPDNAPPSGSPAQEASPPASSSQPSGSPASGVSPGKAAMIEDVQALNPSLPFEDLAALSAEELEQLWETGAPGLPIGISAAAQAAEEYAGTLAVDSVTSETDPELDEAPPHYEVELHHPTLGDFEYQIDAYSGQVLEGAPDILKSVQASGGPQEAPGTPGGQAAPATQSPAPGTPAPGAQAPASNTPAPSPAASGEEAAKSAAFAHAGVSAADASSLRCKLEWDDGQQVYDIDFWVGDTEYNYKIDASTYAVLEAEQERQGRPAGSQAAGAFIGEEAAKRAALDHAGVSASGSGFLKCELDEDDGLWVYEIEFRAEGVKYDYEIDASSGAVRKAEQEH